MRKFLCLIICFTALLVFAQEPVPAARPKIGLALEGGGALGLAHIGVLEWFEEHRIPVDDIAGTSMGGLVGGIYATGLDAREVRQLVTGIDWNGVLRGETDFADLSFRRKEDRTDYPAGFEFGLRHGIAFPGGFNSGHQVGLILDRIALPYSTLKNFDELPTPFRCVSTELTHRELHVFKDGPLSDALRSTMSIPGFFTPVRLNGKVYVDGGLLDNLPTDIAKEMGADKVIAVHLENAQLNAETPLSSFSVLGESIAAVVATNERHGMELANAVIRVDLRNFSSTSFNSAAKIIAKGYEAAQQNAAELEKYSLDEAAWQQYKAEREARRIHEVPIPQFVQVQGTTPGVAASLQRQLNDFSGRAIDVPRLEKQLTQFTGTGRFASVGYSLTKRDDTVGLDIQAAEKQYAPPTVNPSIVIDGADYMNVRFGVGARFTFLDLGHIGSELRTDVLVGSLYHVGAEYYRPIGDAGRWFVAPGFDGVNAPFDVYSRNRRLAEYRYRYALGRLDLGYNFDRHSELRVGYEAGWLQYEPDLVRLNVLTPVEGRQGVTRVSYRMNRLDDAVIPSNGVALNTSFGFYDTRPGALDRFPSLETQLEGFKSLKRRDTVFGVVSGASTLGYAYTGIPIYTLGGPFRLSAYGENEILTNQYAYFRTGWLHELFEGPPIIGSRISLMTDFEVAKPYGTPNATRVPMDGSVGVVFETLFGPAYIGTSVGDSGHHRFFFQLGRIF
ncbi:MAG TPA: patatin-like phospholipase family protein [Terriglobales bacterium]|nr:patatin-like phospholipase family protein [Terriglobales bacterium]